jgi:hypothetical protein
MTTALVILGLLAYAHIGYRLGDLSLTLWRKKDNASLAALLLFPVSYGKGVVGDEGKNFLSITDFKGKTWEGDSFGPGGYRILMMVVWPAKLVFNLPPLALYWLGRHLLEPTTKALPPLDLAPPEQLRPAEGDDVHALLEKHRVVSARIVTLEATRTAIDERLTKAKIEADVAVELVEEEERGRHELPAAAKTGAKDG